MTGVPWKATSAVDERMRFLSRLEAGERMTDLCREFGISRKTGYKFLRRYEQLSAIGLVDQRRVPERIPHKTSDEVVELVLGVRKQHPTWGARKIQSTLRRKHPGVRVPAQSTITLILSRNGLTTKRPTRKRWPVEFSPLCHAVEPNDVWCIDFKGQFRLGDGSYCYPLTVTDAATRYILACEAFSAINTDDVRGALEQLFRKHGLPKAIRFDGGAPFASTGVAGLSRLSAWWLELGIKLERIEPASPQQNGRHERMHRTLKAETARPPAKNILQQQERFDRFVEVFNQERPHEALGMQRPAELYRSSERCYPATVVMDYPLHDLVVRVTRCGHARLPGTPRGVSSFFVSMALAGRQLGLRELEEGRWLVSYMTLDLGLFDARSNKFVAQAPPRTQHAAT